MVKSASSPDDPSLKQYWEERMKKKAVELTISKQIIARRQNYVCPVCKTSLFNDEQLHVHHVIPKERGGTDTYSNLKLLHMICHQQWHSKADQTKRESNESFVV